MFMCLFFSAGILLAGLLPHLDFTPLFPLFAGICLFLFGIVRNQFSGLLRASLRVFGSLFFGLAWGVIAGQWLIADQLAPELEGEVIALRGVVSDLPENRGDYVRFRFAVEQSAEIAEIPAQLLLSWYGAPDLKVGQRWVLSLKLRRPRGSVNEGGFDYQRWLLGQGIGGTGYIVKSAVNQLIANDSGYTAARLRESLRRWINTTLESEERNLLIALLVGDSSQISSAQWQVLKSTGTSHLMAISGLHIGLVALYGYLLGKWLLVLLNFLPIQIRWRYHIPALFSVFFALSYAVLAGFALPTKRALVMVAVFHLGTMLYRRVPTKMVFCLAVLAVLLIDPLAGYELGFWLSFSAVALLLAGFSGRFKIRNNLTTDADYDNRAVPQLTFNHLNVDSKLLGGKSTNYFSALKDFLSRRFVAMITFARAQWLMLIGLFLPLSALNQTVTLLSPVANLLAIPLVSFLVVVPLLLSAVLHWVNFSAAIMLLEFAQFHLALCWQWLCFLDEYSYSSAQLTAIAVPSMLSFCLAVVGLIWLIAPKGFPARPLATLLFLPLFFPHSPTQHPLVIHVLDVGQGLAVVVQVEDRVLLYDAGPAPSERFDAGSAIVIPFLRAQGVEKIDRLIVSHGDNDHAGGARSVIESMTVVDMFQGEEFGIAASGRDNKLSTIPDICEEDVRWQWHDVNFELIEPHFAPSKNDHNNRSCVLKITYQNQIVLLPGDIDAKVERSLLANGKLTDPLVLLVAAHHGSRTSSSPEFVSQLHPEYVVYSAGYQNRYRHPHPLVVERFQQVGSRAYQTGELGRLSFVWDKAGAVSIDALRKSNRRYWYFDSSVEPVTVSAAGIQANYGKVSPR